MTSACLFWRTSDFYGPFSNFSRHPITVNGKFYATTEHYYQACKAVNQAEHEKIRLAGNPKLAKEIAQTVELRPNWDTIKLDVMMEALLVKVEQHPKIAELLLSTGDAEIVENSPYDYIWGCGADGSGANLLGKCWMEVREILREKVPS